MSQIHSICKFLLQSFIIFQVLSSNPEAKFTNNHTLIKIINEMRATWKAGENNMQVPDRFTVRRPKRDVVKAPTLRPKHTSTPPRFDARRHWRHCRRIIRRIRAQGECGSCWAIASASMLSDRMCIESNATIRVHLSTEDLITCCDICRIPNTISCYGGWPQDAIYYWTRVGIVTGGEVNSEEGCKPYSRQSHNNVDVECTKSCSNKKYHKQYEQDKYKGKMVYFVEPTERAIMDEIFQHGPVVAVLDVYTDMEQYKSGVYKHLTGQLLNEHAVKILGWGVESGVKYWLVANTWGTQFGIRGFMKIVRGENNCKIEEHVVAGRMLDPSYGRERIGRTGYSSADNRTVFLWNIFVLCVFGFLNR